MMPLRSIVRRQAARFSRAQLISDLRPKMSRYLIALVLSVAGCAMSPDSAESAREIVLTYVGADVGTAGPFSKKGLRELDTLSAKDRAEALALFERGAIAYVIFSPPQERKPADTAAPTRIIFVRSGKVVADFRGTEKTPAR
jgi:hypothetical protein